VTLDFNSESRVDRCRLLLQSKNYNHVIKIRKDLTFTENPVVQEITRSILCEKENSNKEIRKYISQESVIDLKTSITTVIIDTFDKINKLK